MAAAFVVQERGAEEDSLGSEPELEEVEDVCEMHTVVRAELSHLVSAETSVTISDLVRLDSGPSYRLSSQGNYRWVELVSGHL
jgi:hypothetical protein